MNGFLRVLSLLAMLGVSLPVIALDEEPGDPPTNACGCQAYSEVVNGCSQETILEWDIVPLKNGRCDDGPCEVPEQCRWLISMSIQCPDTECLAQVYINGNLRGQGAGGYIEISPRTEELDCGDQQVWALGCCGVGPCFEIYLACLDCQQA